MGWEQLQTVEGSEEKGELEIEVLDDEGEQGPGTWEGAIRRSSSRSRISRIMIDQDQDPSCQSPSLSITH